jgi:hypothetical protein
MLQMFNRENGSPEMLSAVEARDLGLSKTIAVRKGTVDSKP